MTQAAEPVYDGLPVSACDWTMGPFRPDSVGHSGPPTTTRGLVIDAPFLPAALVNTITVNTMPLRPLLTVTTEDISCLHPPRLINDSVINAYFRIIERRSLFYRMLPKVFALDTFFLFEWERGKYERTKRCLKTVDPFSTDLILVPVHVTTLGPHHHWALIAVRPKLKRIEAYDSLGHSRMSEMIHMREFLKENAKAQRIPFFDAGWNLTDTPPDCPRQQDMVSCGVFTCIYAEKLARGSRLSNFKVDVLQSRRTIADIIRRGRFDHENFTRIELVHLLEREGAALKPAVIQPRTGVTSVPPMAPIPIDTTDDPLLMELEAEIGSPYKYSEIAVSHLPNCSTPNETPDISTVQQSTDSRLGNGDESPCLSLCASDIVEDVLPAEEADVVMRDENPPTPVGDKPIGVGASENPPPKSPRDPSEWVITPALLQRLREEDVTTLGSKRFRNRRWRIYRKDGTSFRIRPDKILSALSSSLE